MAPPVQYVNGKKTVTMLENNPAVMNQLAYKLGLDTSLAFHDVYSLTDPDMLAMIPRPVLALLVIIPLTSSWHASRTAEDDAAASDDASSPYHTYHQQEQSSRDPPPPGNDDNDADSAPDRILWIPQTLGNACGSIGLLHCLLNGGARRYIRADSKLATLQHDLMGLSRPMDRAARIYDDDEFVAMHQSVAEEGDTKASKTTAADDDVYGGHPRDQHFVAFVKAADGRLWELEGDRKGALDRGVLGPDESQDLLCEEAVRMGIGRVMEMERQAGGDLRFSCIALAASQPST